MLPTFGEWLSAPLVLTFSSFCRQVLMELGDIKKQKIDQALMSNHYQVANAVTQLLINWRHSQGTKARIFRILKAMQRVDELHPGSIDWDLVKKIANNTL
jgi:hypothetical protein